MPWQFGLRWMLHAANIRYPRGSVWERTVQVRNVRAVWHIIGAGRTGDNDNVQHTIKVQGEDGAYLGTLFNEDLTLLPEPLPPLPASALAHSSLQCSVESAVVSKVLRALLEHIKRQCRLLPCVVSSCVRRSGEPLHCTPLRAIAIWHCGTHCAANPLRRSGHAAAAQHGTARHGAAQHCGRGRAVRRSGCASGICGTPARPQC
jgi:hypothetical protein